MNIHIHALKALFTLTHALFNRTFSFTLPSPLWFGRVIFFYELEMQFTAKKREKNLVCLVNYVCVIKKYCKKTVENRKKMKEFLFFITYSGEDLYVWATHFAVIFPQVLLASIGELRVPYITYEYLLVEELAAINSKVPIPMQKKLRQMK